MMPKDFSNFAGKRVKRKNKQVGRLPFNKKGEWVIQPQLLNGKGKLQGMVMRC